MNLIVKILISSFSVMVSAWLLPGVHVDDFLTGIAVALMLAFLNVFLKPILIILTLPATILSFGLFLLVINAIIIYIAHAFIGGFHVDGVFWAILFSIVMSIVTSVFEAINKKEDSGE